MITHNICFCGEIRKIHFWLEKVPNRAMHMSCYMRKWPLLYKGTTMSPIRLPVQGLPCPLHTESLVTVEYTDSKGSDQTQGYVLANLKLQWADIIRHIFFAL